MESGCVGGQGSQLPTLSWSGGAKDNMPSVSVLIGATETDGTGSCMAGMDAAWGFRFCLL